MSGKDTLFRYGQLLADMAELNKLNELKQKMQTKAEDLVCQLERGEPITADEHLFLRSWTNAQPKKKKEMAS
jgi:hypothetical protein